MVIGITSVVLQLFCIICITYFKWKYHVEDINQQHVNASFRLNNTIGENLDLVDERQQSVFTIRELLVNELETVRNKGYQSSNVPILTASTSHFRWVNNVTYNKTIIEVCHILFVAVIVVLHLTQQQVKKSLNPASVADIPYTILYMLDMGPVILISFVLPLMIYLSHSEIRIYFKGCFYV